MSHPWLPTDCKTHHHSASMPSKILFEGRNSLGLERRFFYLGTVFLVLSVICVIL